MDKNLQDLTNAAKAKLQKQKADAEQAGNGDIYADIKREMEGEEYNTYPTLLGAPPQQETQRGVEFSDNTDYDVPNPIEDDFQIYDNGPLYSQLLVWKKQYGEGHVYHVNVSNHDFIIRSLNRYEYKQAVAMENVDALMREEIFCATCVLHPFNYDFKKMAADDAGFPSTLAQIILETSGFTKEYAIEVL